jgi:hypothetical protein
MGIFSLGCGDGRLAGVRKYEFFLRSVRAECKKSEPGGAFSVCTFVFAPEGIPASDRTRGF